MAENDVETITEAPSDFIRDIVRADLAAGHLGDVDAAVGAGTKPVGAEQPARTGHRPQLPTLGGDGIRRGVPGLHGYGR